MMKCNKYQITFSEAAIDQIMLINSNDFTLESKVLRLTINGKECDGFTYAIGFSEPAKNDEIIQVNNQIQLHMDKFTAFYFKRGFVDYILDPESQNDGFVVSNFDQEQFHGKFFKDGNHSPELSELL